MDNPNCDKCIRRKHCFVKEFTVLSCEDYKTDDSAGDKEKESADV